MDNLDARINQYSYEMVNALQKNDFNMIDKALGILANDGVYAYYLYCLARKPKNPEKQQGGRENPIGDKIYEVFVKDIVTRFGGDFGLVPKEAEGHGADNAGEKSGEQRFFERLAEDVHQLFAFKDILERILIYARYHAKAAGK